MNLFNRLKICNPLQKRKGFSTLAKVTSEVGNNIHLEIMECIEMVQKKNPLVHCITNRVSAQKIANSLLAFGASPAMIDNPKEVEEFAQISSATYFNLGLHTSQIDNIKIIEKLRKQAKKDNFLLVVDPLAVGATQYRTSIIKDILIKCQPNVIKGNVSEIYYLDTEKFLGKGVDSNSKNFGDNFNIINHARNVAEKYNCTVVVTANNDIVVSPCTSKVAKLNLDLPILTKITGTGCTIGALCAATISVNPQNTFIACTAAILLYKLAAWKSYQQEKSPGSLHHKLIDDIYYYSNNSKHLPFHILDIYTT